MKPTSVITASNEKDKKVPEGTIQVIQKGGKEVLTTNKIPENATVNSYKPDVKEKKEGATNTKKSEEKQPSKATDKITKGSGTHDTNNVKTEKTNEKDKKVPEGSIQVIKKGDKEVLTTNRIPENAVVNTYKPDIKEKEGATNARTSEEKQSIKATDKTTKGSSSKETNDLKANQTSEKDKSTIQVIQKGGKEVLTNKIPSNAVVNTYKPDVKEKKDEATTAKVSETKVASKATDKSTATAKGSNLKDANDTTANQTKVQSTKVCLFSELQS